MSYLIVNNSTGIVTVQSSGAKAITTLDAGTSAAFTCILTSGTTAASWDYEFVGFNATTGTGSVVRATSPTITGAVLNSMGSSVITSGTAVASTSGTSIDFTSIPSWVKRITVMFDGVSTNGTSNVVLQLGDSGGIETTGYVGSHTALAASAVSTNSTTANITVYSQSAATNLFSGVATICLIGSNTWAVLGTTGSAVPRGTVFSGSKALSGTLDRIRIAGGNGTDTFDAGTINILFE
jgi:hypothetical protein